MKPARTRARLVAAALVAATAVLVTLAEPPAAASAGDDFSFYEQGARASALGGAFTARSDEVSTLFYNPAGLAFLGGVRIKTNLNFGNRDMSAAWPGSDGVFTSEPKELQGSFAVSWQPVRRITLGIGYSTPWSYESLWSPGWSGRTACKMNLLRARTLSVNAAVELFKGFAVGGGWHFATSDLEWQHDLYWNLPNYPLEDDLPITSAHALKGKGWGFMAGAMWKIVPALAVGARYRQSIAVDYTGQNVFRSPISPYTSVPLPTGGSTYVGNLVTMFFVEQDVAASLTLPRQMACGALLTPVKPLSLSVDLQWDRWSEFGDWVISSVEEVLAPYWTELFADFYGIAPDYGVQGVPLVLADTLAVKAGLEYRVTPHIALRAGFARHRSAVAVADRTPVYPDLARSILSFGFGYEGPLFSIWGDGERVSDLSFDLFVRYAAASDGPSAYPGYEMTYESSRIVAGVGAGFSF